MTSPHRIELSPDKTNFATVAQLLTDLGAEQDAEQSFSYASDSEDDPGELDEEDSELDEEDVDEQ